MGKHYTLELKAKVVGFRSSGFSIRQIAKKLQIPVSTAQKIIEKYNKTGCIDHMKGNGRPSKLNNNLMMTLLSENSKNGKLSLRKKAESIQNKLDINISHSCIKKYLNLYNIHAYSPTKKPLLRPHHIISRFNHARDWIMMKEKDCKNIIFSDESKFNLYNHDGKVKVWRKPDERLKSENLNQTLKFGGGSVMVWGCFSYYGVGELVFIDQRMDAAYYCNMLSGSLFSSIEKMGISDYIFMQDNDPKHTSKLAKEFFNTNNVKLLSWPAQSPDCNPIENLWGYIKGKIGDKTFRSKNDLKDEIRRIWNEITIEQCQKLSKSFKKRAYLLYKAKGKHINK